PHHCFTHMSIGTPAPALLHSKLGGQRAGGFFFGWLGSAGMPGVTFGIPASNDAQGNTQKAFPMAFPCESLCETQRWEACLQSLFFLQLLPRPTVRGSRDGFFAERASAAAARRRAASSACIRSASA